MAISRQGIQIRPPVYPPVDLESHCEFYFVVEINEVLHAVALLLFEDSVAEIKRALNYIFGLELQQSLVVLL